MFQVFLSYASEDLAFAEALAAALESEGLRTFLAPRGVSGGSDWRVRLRDELDHCNACIAVLTDAFRRSRWCDQEVGYAMGSGRPVIPVRPAVVRRSRRNRPPAEHIRSQPGGHR